MPTIENIFVIGGEMVYKQAINHTKCRKIYLNKISVPCDLGKSDTFFPKVVPSIYRLIEKKEIDPSVTSYVFVKLH
jgi:dihydrofolate reductase